MIDIQKEIDRLFPNFEFRQFQRETITHIIQSYIDNPNSNIIIDAPTGSGKSIISMFSSLILNETFEKSGYILTSDTTLQDQYEDDVKHYKFPYVSVKGLDNYTCDINYNKMSTSDCTLKNIKGANRIALPCYENCAYYSRRDAASIASTSILNYNYWLMQQHYVTPNTPLPKFSKRNFVFFDEAHNVVNIVANHFSPKIHQTLITNIQPIIDYNRLHKLFSDDPNVIFNKINKIFNNLKKDMPAKDVLILLSYLEQLLKKLVVGYPILLEENESIAQNNEKISDQNIYLLKMFKNITDNQTKIKDYINVVKTDPDNLVHKQYFNDSISLNCLEPSYMMKKVFHKLYNFGIFMSATFLNHNFFIEHLGIKNTKVIEIPSTFNYKNSPIHFYSNFDMSYAKKDENIEKQIAQIDVIVSEHKSGIIHTGSFSNAMSLKEHTKTNKKIRFYKNTAEKNALILELRHKKNFFIAGPSILEGIDMKDDMSRCQIFMKVPYLNLGDSYIKKRFEKNKNWYLWETSINFVQGIGRSIRSKDDYCETYILDKGFYNILKTKVSGKSILPEFITRRIKIYR
jgi:Rad3-related DNA helicase